MPQVGRKALLSHCITLTAGVSRALRKENGFTPLDHYAQGNPLIRSNKLSLRDLDLVNLER